MSISKISTDNNATELAGKVNEIIDSVNAGSSGSSSGEVNTAFTRNRNRGSVLFSQAKYANTNNRLPQFLVVTDNHESGYALANAINLSDNFDSIMGIVQLGDLVNTYDKTDNTYKDTAVDVIKTSTKPVYMVIGNHDVGNSANIHRTASNAELYNSFIKPMVDKGWLVNGEYTVNKAYWYHDITYRTDKKLRLIAINEYDYPDADSATDFDTTYWTPVTYDGTAAVMQYNHAYSANDVVNVKGYTQFSFKCVQSCATPISATSADDTTHHGPKYKYTKGVGYVSQTQAEWLVSTLNSVPAGASVVILMHQTIIDPTGKNVFQTERKFCSNDCFVNQSSYQNDSIVYQLLEAYINESNGTLTVVLQNKYSSLSDILPSVSVSYDFRIKDTVNNIGNKNSGVVVLPSLNGHTHDDEILVYNHVCQFSSICTGSSYSGGPDIIRGVNATGKFITDDCVNVVTYEPDALKIKLCKLGATYTNDGYQRDEEEMYFFTPKPTISHYTISDGTKLRVTPSCPGFEVKLYMDGTEVQLGSDGYYQLNTLPTAGNSVTFTAQAIRNDKVLTSYDSEIVSYTFTTPS